MKITTWILIIWLDGSGKAIQIVPGEWPTIMQCMEAARSYLPIRMDRFCFPVVRGEDDAERSR